MRILIIGSSAAGLGAASFCARLRARGRYRPDLAPDAAARPGAGDRRRPVGRGDCGPSPGGAHTAGSAPHRAAGRSHAGACSRLPVVAGLGRVRCLRPCTPVSDPGRAAVGHSRPGAARHRRSGVRRAGARPHRRPPRWAFPRADGWCWRPMPGASRSTRCWTCRTFTPGSPQCVPMKSFRRGWPAATPAAAGPGARRTAAAGTVAGQLQCAGGQRASSASGPGGRTAHPSGADRRRTRRRPVRGMRNGSVCPHPGAAARAARLCARTPAAPVPCARHKAPGRTPVPPRRCAGCWPALFCFQTPLCFVPQKSVILLADGLRSGRAFVRCCFGFWSQPRAVEKRNWERGGDRGSVQAGAAVEVRPLPRLCCAHWCGAVVLVASRVHP